MDRYSLKADAFPTTPMSLTSPGNSPSPQSQPNSFYRKGVHRLWAVLSALRRARNHIDGFQARIIWEIVVLIFCILRVEFTIAANQIQGVNELDTTGQLIPFVVSLGAMLALIAEAITRERRKVYGFPLLAGKISPNSPDENV